jgi:uncharacterized caspase-like protein
MKKILFVLLCLCWVQKIFAQTQVLEVESEAVNLDIRKAPKGKRLALLIGNANYAKSPLTNPINDATDIAKVLKENCGFETTLKTDLDLRQMADVISTFANQIQDFKKQGYHVTALFYYAGHGLQHQNENYMLPLLHNVGAVGDIPYQSYPNSRILSNLAEAHTQIVMIDACRTVPFRTFFRDYIEDFAEGLLAPTVPPFKPSQNFKEMVQGSFISFSAAPNSKAQDGMGRNSPYATAFLKVLRENGGLELRSFFAKVKEEVFFNLTKGTQRSWATDDLIGDFYFTK